MSCGQEGEKREEEKLDKGGRRIDRETIKEIIVNNNKKNRVIRKKI